MAEYGGTLDTVRAFLPHRTIDDESKPSDEQVGTYLTTIRGQVLGRLGPADLLPDVYADGTVGRRAVLLDFAEGVIGLGAAAMTEDASFPERADPTANSRYGAVLWERYRQALDDLARAAGETADGAGGGVSVGGPADLPSAVFPPPAGFASAGW